MQDISISNYFLTTVLKNATSKGINVPKLLARVNVPRRLFSEPGSRITAEQFAALQSIAMREMDAGV